MAKVVTDSFTQLKKLSDGAFDHIITDPPYSEHVQKNLSSGSVKGTKRVPKLQLPFDPLTEYAWIHDCLRVAKRWVIVFCALEDFGNFTRVAGKAYVRGAIWYKPNSMGQLTKDRPATAYEGMAIFHVPTVKKKWNGHGSFGIWKCNGTRGLEGRHPNEKPINLALKLTALFTDRGDSILDPFCGSGALGEAAVRLGRKWEGWDNDPTWVSRTNARLATSTSKDTDADALALCRMNGNNAGSWGVLGGGPE